MNIKRLGSLMPTAVAGTVATSACVSALRKAILPMLSPVALRQRIFLPLTSTMPPGVILPSLCLVVTS